MVNHVVKPISLQNQNHQWNGIKSVRIKFEKIRVLNNKQERICRWMADTLHMFFCYVKNMIFDIFSAVRYQIKSKND